MCLHDGTWLLSLKLHSPTGRWLFLFFIFSVDSSNLLSCYRRDLSFYRKNCQFVFLIPGLVPPSGARQTQIHLGEQDGALPSKTALILVPRILVNFDVKAPYTSSVIEHNHHRQDKDTLRYVTKTARYHLQRCMKERHKEDVGRLQGLKEGICPSI